MDDAMRKSAVLIEALPYIRGFRDKVVVIKFGGAAMEEPSTLAGVLQDVVFLETVGMKPLLVHGGGPAISRRMKARRIEPDFVHGHRRTDAATFAIVREVLAEINGEICRRLDALEGRPCAMTDPAALRAKRRVLRETLPDGTVETCDIGLVGDLIGLDAARFEEILAERRVPVVAPLARSEAGEELNCNADMVAAQAAVSLRAEKVVFLTDIHGIRTDPQDPASRIGTLTRESSDRLIADGVISGGMLPKVAACLQALEGGVHKAHILDGRLTHALLLEIFTDEGVGTQFVH
jgi:acetylglutamate kinase